MKSSVFEQRSESRWQALESMLDRLDEGSPGEDDARRLPGLFRQACSDLALAQDRMYGLALCERINRMVIRSYRHLHREPSSFGQKFHAAVFHDFPNLVRAEWRLLWLTMVFFWVPFGAMYSSSYFDMRWAESILGPEQMVELQAGFGKEGGVEESRDNFGANFLMFGHYIANNIGIDFRTFAGGILGGVGTLFFVVFNGIAVGAAAGYVAQEGDPQKFVEWISGHSVPEFLGLLFSAMAGLRLGMGLIRPGRYSRRQSLARAARPAIRLLYGAAVVTFLAAIIEGFWSPLQLPLRLKYAMGLTLLTLFLMYLLLAGRGRREA